MVAATTVVSNFNLVGRLTGPGLTIRLVGSMGERSRRGVGLCPPGAVPVPSDPDDQSRAQTRAEGISEATRRPTTIPCR